MSRSCSSLGQIQSQFVEIIVHLRLLKSENFFFFEFKSRRFYPGSLTHIFI